MHWDQFREILRDAEIARVITPVVRAHHLGAPELEKILVELKIPRAADIAFAVASSSHVPPDA